ncbi:MAG: tripartite tricarboxylate transporter substrate binding protein [Burkholderiaceae bacterium]|nr:tripartite tricarboxylate transporter substrate binding protein [Burkholderiaceae bacterium]
MKTLIQTARALCALVLGCSALAASAQAPQYPDRPVRVVIPFPPAGGTDIVGRTLVNKLSTLLGQPMVIENRTGGNTVVGTNYVAKAPADGYTLLFTSSSHTANPALLKNLPYDTLKDFQPLCLAALHPFVLLANPQMPFTTLRELITYAKANPGKLNYASAGNGTAQHLVMEELKRLAGIDITHIPYKGSQDMATDLIAGRVAVMFNGISPTLAFMRSGRMRPLAVDSAKRVPLLADVPTVVESGVAGFTNVNWSGLVGPASMPRPVVDKINAACATALGSSDVNGTLTGLGLEPTPGWSPAQFQDFMKQDMERWGVLVKNSGAKVD